MLCIELGGEDAKILFVQRQRRKMRMNAFMRRRYRCFYRPNVYFVALIPQELNNVAKEHEKIYTIASRCGVFAKSDIQPLLNQGARKSDIAASIFSAGCQSNDCRFGSRKRNQRKCCISGRSFSLFYLNYAKVLIQL